MTDETYKVVKFNCHPHVLDAIKVLSGLRHVREGEVLRMAISDELFFRQAVARGARIILVERGMETEVLLKP